MQEHHILYLTTCQPTGCWYGGAHSTNNLNDGYLGSGVALKESIRKYGKSAHERVVLCHFKNREDLLECEAAWIDKVATNDPTCLNRKTGGHGGGSTHSAASRAKMSASQRGNKNCVGRVVTEETRRRISEAKLGRPGHPMSHAHKERLRALRAGKPSPNKGTKFSAEHKEALSRALKAYHARRKAGRR